MRPKYLATPPSRFRQRPVSLGANIPADSLSLQPKESPRNAHFSARSRMPAIFRADAALPPMRAFRACAVRRTSATARKGSGTNGRLIRTTTRANDSPNGRQTRTAAIRIGCGTNGRLFGKAAARMAENSEVPINLTGPRPLLRRILLMRTRPDGQFIPFAVRRRAAGPKCRALLSAACRAASGPAHRTVPPANRRIAEAKPVRRPVLHRAFRRFTGPSRSSIVPPPHPCANSISTLRTPRRGVERTSVQRTMRSERHSARNNPASGGGSTRAKRPPGASNRTTASCNSSKGSSDAWRARERPASGEASESTKKGGFDTIRS